MTDVIIFVILGFVLFIELTILLYGNIVDCFEEFWHLRLNLLGKIIFFPIYLILTVFMMVTVLILTPFTYKRKKSK